MKASFNFEFPQTTPAPAATSQLIGFEPAAGARDVVLLPAGHAPGLYQIARAIVQRDPSVTGWLPATMRWKPPNIDPVAPAAPMIIGGITPGSTMKTSWEYEIGSSAHAGGCLHMPSSPIVIASDGTQDAVVSLGAGAAAGIRFDVYLAATLIAPIATVEP